MSRYLRGVLATFIVAGPLASPGLCQSGEAPALGSIVGRVVDTRSNEPLAGVTVHLDAFGEDQAATRTDADGSFRFESVLLGRHWLRVTCRRCSKLEMQAEVTAGEVATVDFDMRPNTSKEKDFEVVNAIDFQEASFFRRRVPPGWESEPDGVSNSCGRGVTILGIDKRLSSLKDCSVEVFFDLSEFCEPPRFVYRPSNWPYLFVLYPSKGKYEVWSVTSATLTKAARAVVTNLSFIFRFRLEEHLQTYTFYTYPEDRRGVLLKTIVELHRRGEIDWYDYRWGDEVRFLEQQLALSDSDQVNSITDGRDQRPTRRSAATG